MIDTEYSFCRVVTETSNSGQPIRYCSKRIDREVQAEVGRRYGLTGPIALAWCSDHLAKLPIWP